MNKYDFLSALAQIRTCATFLTLKGYQNEHSEIADYNLIFHMSYKSALERSVAALQLLTPASDLEEQAKKELLTSFSKSLSRLETTPAEELDDNYTHFTTNNGEYIKGIKLHTKTNTLHLYGLVVNKKVLIPGFYPDKQESPLTKVKGKMRHSLPIGKYRQFKILPSQLDEICVENISLQPPM